MDIEQARTFLVIAAHGSFLEAAHQLHLTQSTISARIKRLEEELKVSLFERSRNGADLTLAGSRFLSYARRLVVTADQALHDVPFAESTVGNIHIGARIALCEGILPRWVGWMRDWESKIAIHCEIGFEEDLIHRLIEGTLDVGLMYSPIQGPGLVIEHLFNEKIVLVSTRQDDTGLANDYIYIHWGQDYYAQHKGLFPEFDRPSQVANIGWLGIQLILANGGSCFLPKRLADPLLANNRVHRVEGIEEITQPTYVVYSRNSDNMILNDAIQGLRNQMAESH